MTMKTPHPGTQTAPLSHRFFWLLLRGITRLNYRQQKGLSRILTGLAPTIARRRIQIVRTNLKLCFPDLSDEALARRVKDVTFSTILGLLETLTAWVRPERVDGNKLTIDGLELLTDPRRPDQGILLVGMHFATLDMIGGLLGQYVDFDVMYKPSRQPFVEALMCYGRGHYFEGVIPQNNIREVIKRLKAGRIVWYAPDQDYGAKQSVFAPFFGIPAATITATSRLATMTGAKIVFMSHFRQSPDGYLLNLQAPPETLPTGDDLRDAEIMNRVIESEVRKAPAEYWWVHRRFKSAPEGGRRDLYASKH